MVAVIHGPHVIACSCICHCETRSKLDGETIGDSSAVKQDDPEG